MFTDPVTGQLCDGVYKVRYTHEAMAERIIADPSVSQNCLAAIFGYSPAWISRIVNSDAFQTYLHDKKELITDPALKAAVEARMRDIEAQLRAVAELSLQRISERLAEEARPDPKFMMEAAKLSTAALGYGARTPSAPAGPAVVINLPNKAADAQTWLQQAKPKLESVERLDS